MTIQSWIILGLVVGWLVGVLVGRSFGIAGDFILGIIGGLVGGSLASILFVISGSVNEADVFSIIVAFTCAAILLAIKRVVARPSGSSARSCGAETGEVSQTFPLLPSD